MSAAKPYKNMAWCKAIWAVLPMGIHRHNLIYLPFGKMKDVQPVYAVSANTRYWGCRWCWSQLTLPSIKWWTWNLGNHNGKKIQSGVSFKTKIQSDGSFKTRIQSGVSFKTKMQPDVSLRRMQSDFPHVIALYNVLHAQWPSPVLLTCGISQVVSQNFLTWLRKRQERLS